MNLRKAVPYRLQRQGRRLGITLAQRNVAKRLPPDFLIIGGQRCGTTSLFRALMAHPQIRRPNLHKGVNYFDLNYDQGEQWYRAHFPRRSAGQDLRVFDASGYYMFHPLAAQRIADDLPSVKVIAMVRDPVERAFSAYKHELARGFEWESTFERALELEDLRLAGEAERMVAEPGYASFNHRHHAYRGRGRYAELLQPFIDRLGHQQVLVIESERFFATPEPVYREITDFLDISDTPPTAFERYNARPGKDLAVETHAALRGAFASHDEALGKILGREVIWRQNCE